MKLSLHIKNIINLFVVAILFNFAYAQPANDACAGAIALNIGGCDNGSITAATADNLAGEAGCATAGNAAQHRDVWYRFTASNNLFTISFTGANAAASTAEIVLASGTCGSLTYVNSVCSAAGVNASIPLTQFVVTPGVQYFVLISYASNVTGNFQICTTNNTNGTSDCEYAQQVCSNTAINANSPGFGRRELGFTAGYLVATANCNAGNQAAARAAALASCEASYGVGSCTFLSQSCVAGINTIDFNVFGGAAIGGCLASGENQTSWFYINIQTSGTLLLDIDPTNNSDDYDFAIWGPFTAATAGANCPPIAAPTRCSFSGNTDVTGLRATAGDASEDDLGDSFVSPLNVNAGDVFIMVIDNFSNSGNPYNLTWGGTAVLGCTPIVLPVELTDFVGKNRDNDNILNWETASEFNNDYFSIERSTDGENWITVGHVDGTGTTQEKQHYELVDNDFDYKLNFYRLSQVDMNGVSKVYKTIAIDNSLENKTLLNVVNILGQKVDEHYKGLVIYTYTDGTIIRKMQN